MFRRCSHFRRHSRWQRTGRPAAARRRGLTLLELLIAASIMVMVVGTLATLAKAIEQASEYTEGHSTAIQHARVVLERIARTVREATANEQFPGLIVLSDVEGPWRFPDTLVVWRPAGSAADADGLPRFNELVVYCPYWEAPGQLVEVTFPGDARAVPPPSDTAAWEAQMSALRSGASARVVTLTSLMRTCAVPGSADVPWRGALRFEVRVRPSESDWSDYGDGSLNWDDLDWVQGIHGSQTGLRQVWLRSELQLVPGDGELYEAIPFFGSAALYYELHR